ncbi:hypothetical protein A3Q56_00445 [Intoshia linei]|uniref:Uncharacterized protein n=1 Tax=Intoshia linei TaxID=1819745 RepID=A0A177BC27_9BILA|nr:hypothetical protein A3Q56_00445 [Intoshia linei]
MLQNKEFQEKNGIIYHSSVRWLSQAKVLKRVFELKQPIINFFEALEKECILTDADFLLNMAFLLDIMLKQNDLNMFLQENQKNIYRV